jgi:hypothetical protein
MRPVSAEKPRPYERLFLPKAGVQSESISPSVNDHFEEYSVEKVRVFLAGKIISFISFIINLEFSDTVGGSGQTIFSVRVTEELADQVP